MTTTPTLVLVSHHLCPYVQRAAISLAEKGIPFERVNIDLAAKPAWFTALSPLGKVPLLRVDDEVIFESNVICEYLEETLPPPLHPAAALTRAKHRAYMEFGSAVLGDLWGLQTATEEGAFRKKCDDVAAKFRHLEGVLGEGPYFAGAAFSLVDAVFGPVFRYFDVFDPLVDTGVFQGTLRVSAWRAALATRPSVRAAVGEDYGVRLHEFLRQKNAYVLRAAG